MDQKREDPFSICCWQFLHLPQLRGVNQMRLLLKSFEAKKSFIALLFTKPFETLCSAFLLTRAILQRG